MALTLSLAFRNSYPEFMSPVLYKLEKFSFTTSLVITILRWPFFIVFRIQNAIYKSSVTSFLMCLYSSA